MEVYKEHGAKLVDAHGVLTGTKEIVPPNTVVMFLARPGYCLLIASSRLIARNFFETKTGLESFLLGNKKNYKHVSDISRRTHRSGTQYLDMWLEMSDKNAKGIGYVKKLPLTRQQYVAEFRYQTETPPTFAETSGPITRGHIKLSDLLRKTGPGVYIVSACRVSKFEAQKKILPTNTPLTGWPYINTVHPPRKGVIARLIKSIPKVPSKTFRGKQLKLHGPGPRNYELFGELMTLKKYREPKTLENKIKNVLTHMSRDPSGNLRTYIAPLRANTNVTRLQKTLNALKNPSAVFKGLSLANKARYLAQPSKRAEIIYKTTEKA